MMNTKTAIAALILSAVGLAPLQTAVASENHDHDKAGHAQSQMMHVAEAAGEHDMKAHDHGAHHASLSVDKAWTRATPPGAKVAGGFVTITNAGKEVDHLIGGSFALSKRVEVHEMSMTDGVMRMGEVKGGLEIAPGATVELKPGGYHLMLMGLTDGPKAGDTVKGTLRFEKAGEIKVEFAVAPIGAKSIDGAAGNDHGGHDKKHNH